MKSFIVEKQEEKISKKQAKKAMRDITKKRDWSEVSGAKSNLEMSATEERHNSKIKRRKEDTPPKPKVKPFLFGNY